MELKIDRLDHNGRGISKIDDKIIFIDNALPNEIVKVKITNEKKKFYEGKVVEYVEKSPKRIDSICPYYGICGGCNLLHMSYDDQLLFKEDKVKDIMKKYAGIEGVVKKIIGSDNNFNYRDKVTFQVDGKIGFFENNSNNIVNIDRCLLITEKMNDILDILNNNLVLSNIDKVVIKDMGKSQLMLILYLHKDENLNYLIDLLQCKVDNIVKYVNNNYYLLNGKSNIIASVRDYNFLVSPDSFFQINLEQTVKLYNKIKEYSDLDSTDKVLDLYCGTGTIGIFLSKYCNKVVGVEINKDAIEDANENKKINKVSNTEFMKLDSKMAISKIDFEPDVIIVDPPRAGLYKKLINDILKIKPKRIVYVSCDAITLARDLKLLSNNYNIVEITPVDMFPNTYHVECVVKLEIK